MLGRFIKLARKIATILLTRNRHGRRYMLRRVLKSSQRYVHPIDAYYNIRTSGFVPNFLNDPGINVAKIASRENNHYAGCQPSCLRKALQSLPDTTQFVFYDYGCGMGRALVTASEFAFRELIGIELSEELCAIAVENAHKIAESFPDRPRISVKQGDAIAVELQGQTSYIYVSFVRASDADINYK